MARANTSPEIDEMAHRATSQAAPRARPDAAQSLRSYGNVAVRHDLLKIGRLPIHFFTAAIIYFAAGVAAAPFVTGTIVEFFYQPAALALVHTFTLGFITSSIMGVMYRYVPALTRHPVQYPRMALWQFWLFETGTLGMIAHFANGVWVGLWWSAIMVVIAAVMFAMNMLPCLWAQVGRGVAETGMFLSICLFLVAASIGLILGLDKSYDFLGGDVLTNLSSHVHFAALGWVTLTICAVSYRMIPAFLLPKIQLPKAAIWQLWTLAAGVLALGATLLLGAPGATLWSVIIALSLLSYMVTMGRLVRTRRMPIDFTPMHALAGIVWLVIAILAGVTLSVIGPQGEAGSRIASAYGALGLLGWIANFVIGMSYQLFPGFVSRARSQMGWAVVTIPELSIAQPRWMVFLGFNGGVACVVAGFIAASIPLARVGSAAIAVSGLTYSVVTLWTLSFAYQQGIPESARNNPLRILPG